MKMKLFALAMISSCAVGCQHAATHTGRPQPKASTSAVGTNLNSLGNSISSAQESVKGVRGTLSEVDAKAVRIQEYIKNW